VNDYRSNLDLPAAAALIRDASGPVVILTHAKPDGDAFGSVVALTGALQLLGRRTHAVLVPPILPGLQMLEGQSLYHVFEDGAALPEAALYVIVDTGAWSQVGPLRPFIEPHLGRTLILDHHLAGDIPAAHRFIDPTAAAACEIISDLIDQLLPGGRLIPEGKGSDAADPELDHTLLDVIHQSLFVGIASDTGWFRFSNATPRTHRLAARLIERGVSHTDLYARIEQSERPEKLKLLIRAVASLKLLADGRAATMMLRKKDFLETGALEEETERLIDIPQQVGSIQAIVLIVEHEDPEQPDKPITRLSLRSKPAPGAVNVSELAAQFGGGGHARAAGAKIDASVDEVAPKVEQALLDALDANS